MPDTDPYRRIASIYDRVVEPMMAGVRRVALEVLPPSPDWRVLDVGCGTGTGMAMYAGTGCTVSGVDASAAMIDRAQTRLGDAVEIRLGGGPALPYEDDRFDLVTMSMVLHEVPIEERVGLVEDMARLTNPGGRMLVTDFRFESLRGWQGVLRRGATTLVERLSGHYDGYRSFREAGGVPPVLAQAGLALEREKILAAGTIAIYVIAPT